MDAITDRKFGTLITMKQMSAPELASGLLESTPDAIALYGASKLFAGGGLADLAVEHLSKG